MTATARQPIDLDDHRGSRWSMHIRDGLVDAKHREAMGEAIWLYLYLHKRCAAKTGLVKLYRHQEAADTLGLSRSAVMRQMDRLEQVGYVIVKRGQHGLSVQITRYEWQPPQSEPSPDVASTLHEKPSDVASTLPPIDAQMSRPRTPDVASTLPPSIFTTSFNGVNDSTTNVVGTDAPRADSQKRSRSRKAGTAAGPAPPSETRQLVVSWMKANEIDGALAGGETHRKYNAWAAQQLAKRDRETVTGFLRWAYSKRRHEGDQYDIVPHIVDERIGQWIAMGRPERYVPRTHQSSSGAGYMPAPLPDPAAPPRWMKEDPRIIDRDLDRNNDRFIRHWGNPPFLMNDEERAAAGVTAW